MKISELTIGKSSVNVEGTIKEVGEPRVFSKFGRELRVADSVLEDNSGSIKLTLWNEDFDRFKRGDKVKVINGFVREFQGEKQLTAGRFGKIEKVGKGKVSEEESEEQEEFEDEEPERETEESEKEEEESEEESEGEEPEEESKESEDEESEDEEPEEDEEG